MGKRRIYLLIIIMSVVVALLTLVQMNIINNAAKIKEEQFDQLVKRCLMHVSMKLEEEEFNQFILNEQMASSNVLPPDFPSGNKPSGEKISQKQINFSFNLTQDNTGKVIAKASVNESDTALNFNSNEPFQNPNMFSELADMTDMEQREFFQRFNDRDLFNRNIQYQLMLANKPIEQRIDPQLLSRLLHEEFSVNGIDMNYEYVVKSYNQGVEKIIFSSKNYKNKHKTEHQTPLFMNDLGSQKPNYLKVYFPLSQKRFLSSVSYLVYPTFILLAFIIGIFAYTIAIIFQQKKLSAIKNDFINNMTHELKTPISTISLASQMLRDNSVNNSPSSTERIFGVIFEESKRLSMQVEKVLQMAVFSEGRLNMKFKNFVLHELIDTIIQNFELRVHSLNGQITFVKNATNSTIYGDQVHITNVLFNLLDNAVKYCKDNPVIEVITENRKDKLIVYVKDNGIGIAKEHQKQIFERFYRVPTGNVHDVKGFGLGLHYVYKIIEAHNGTIEVESTLNKGTTFIIKFPITN
jgi:two-component system, OmpR family, phosphate regulon sensor histidine kinase PhoR